MSLRKLNSLVIAAIALLALASCKKDEETKVDPSLNGVLKFDIDEFIAPGQIITMTPTGLSHPDGKEIGYYWKVTPGMSRSDTTRYENGLSDDGKPSDGSFAYRFSDSLATYTISCYGFAEGYSSSYASAYVTVVKPGLDGSITGTGINKKDPKIEADGIEYYYISHNGLDWFRNNLANPAYGVPYSNAEAVSNVLGRFYSYEEASEACPEGWRLPTDQEWIDLASSLDEKASAEAYNTVPAIASDLMANARMNGDIMWEYWPEVGEITNKGGISMIPAGYSNLGERTSEGKYPTASFFGVFEYAAFWTADKVEDEPGMAYYRYLICDQPDMYAGKGDMNTFGASVRCVRKSE